MAKALLARDQRAAVIWHARCVNSKRGINDAILLVAGLIASRRAS
jgi:hypothetical protein